MRKRMLIVVSTAIVIATSSIFLTYRKQPKPNVPILTIKSVISIQILPSYFTAPHPAPMHPNPKPIYPKDSQTRAIVKKVLTMLSKAKSLRYESQARHVLYGPAIEIKLKNGERLYALIPWLPTTSKQPDGQVLTGSQRSSQDVDVQIGDAPSKVARYYAPALNRWIEGGWRIDVKQSQGR